MNEGAFSFVGDKRTKTLLFTGRIYTWFDMAKLDDKERAIVLRESGLSYREILAEVPVAKSTLSLWLREVGLSVQQRQALSQKRTEAALRGAEAKKRQRLESTAELKRAARIQVGALTSRERMLIGAALYWAEGSKQRLSSTSASVIFGNSDPLMLKFFKEWVAEFSPTSSIKYEIYLHDSQKHRLHEVRQHWSKALGVPLIDLQTVYYKRNSLANRNRKNSENGYYGLVRLRVRASSALNRTITGLVEGIAG